jgi:DNA-binding transcriptional LysR family regulator
MSHVPQTELEQWAVLRTVVEAGSFAKAAQQLNRSQSSVSYAIARLQERLGVALLHVDGRRALLTDAGQLLLAEAVPLIDDLQRLEQRGKLIAKGQEPRIRLVVDSIFPKWLLFDALVAFHTTHRYVEIRLSEVVRRPVPNPAAEPFDLAVTVWDFKAGPARPLMDIEMIAVARPDHPLHARRGRLTLGPYRGMPALLSRASRQRCLPPSSKGFTGASTRLNRQSKRFGEASATAGCRATWWREISRGASLSRCR